LPGAALACVAGIGVLCSHIAVYAQTDAASIADVRGNWSVIVTMVGFENSFDATEEPRFQRIETRFIVTHQQDRLFAGTMPNGSGGGERMIGVVLPDGTLSMQMMALGGGHDRIFLKAALTSENGRYRMTGYGHMFEDLDQTKSPMSGSLQFTATKDD
jgi:hypothetical protein